MKLAAVFLIGLTACGGQVNDRPETLAKLKACQDQAAKDKADRDALQAQLVELQAAAKEIVVRFEGDVLTISAGKTGAGQAALEPSVSEKLSKEFLSQVQKGRGSIQKCYEQMLKKNSAAGSKSVSLSIYATFGSSGEFKSVSFKPALDATFESCMSGLAQKWRVDKAGQPVTFQASVSLTPN